MAVFHPEGSLQNMWQQTAAILQGGAAKFRDSGKSSHRFAEREMSREGIWGALQVAVLANLPSFLIGMVTRDDRACGRAPN